MRRVRYLYGLIFSALLLLVIAGSGLAHRPPPRELSESSTVTTSPAANAPWFNIEIDTTYDVGQHVSVAIDPDTGIAYASYYDASNQELRLANSSNTYGSCGFYNDWDCLRVYQAGTDIGKYSSVAIDPKGGVGIAYHDATNGQLEYIYFPLPNLAPATKSTIDVGVPSVSTTGLYTSLKYDSDGKPYIAYQFYNYSGVEALMWAYYSVTNGNCGHGDAAGKWQCETIITGEGVGKYASQAIEDEWKSHIAYYDEDSSELWYATSVSEGNCGHYGTNWTCYPITGATTDAGQHASIYVDGDGRFHIAYYDATSDELKYAINVGSGGNCGILGSAQCDAIDDMPAGYHPMGISIAEDGAGYPIIAYQSSNGSLNVARPIAALGLTGGEGNCGPERPFATWYCQTIDRSGIWINYRNGDYVSLAVNPAGLATIAYYGFILNTGGNLEVSHQRFQDFLPLTVK